VVVWSRRLNALDLGSRNGRGCFCDKRVNVLHQPYLPQSIHLRITFKVAGLLLLDTNASIYSYTISIYISVFFR
jgi:hypothetical protein